MGTVAGIRTKCHFFKKPTSLTGNTTWNKTLPYVIHRRDTN